MPGLIINDSDTTNMEKLFKNPLVVPRVARLMRRSWNDPKKFAEGVESFFGWRLLNDIEAFCMVVAVCIAADKAVNGREYGYENTNDLKEALYQQKAVSFGDLLGSLASPDEDKSKRVESIMNQRQTGGFKDIFVELLRALAPKSGANPMYADTVYSKLEAKLKKVTPWKKFFKKETQASKTRNEIAATLKKNFNAAVAAKALEPSKSVSPDMKAAEEPNKKVAQFVHFLLATTERKTRQRLTLPKEIINPGNLSSKDLQLALKNLGVVVKEVLKEEANKDKEHFSYRDAARLLRDNIGEYMTNIEKSLASKNSNWKERDLWACCYVYNAFREHYIGDSQKLDDTFVALLEKDNKDLNFWEDIHANERVNYAQKRLSKFCYEFALGGGIPSGKFVKDTVILNDDNHPLSAKLDELAGRFKKISNVVVKPALEKYGRNYLSTHFEPYLSEMERTVINEKFDSEDDYALFVFMFYSICEAYGVTESIDHHDRKYWNFVKSNKKFKDLYDKYGELELNGNKRFRTAEPQESFSKEQTENALKMIEAIEDELTKRGAFDYGDMNLEERLQLSLDKRVTFTSSDLQDKNYKKASKDGFNIWRRFETSFILQHMSFAIYFDRLELANKYDELKNGGTPQKKYADLILSEYQKAYTELSEEDRQKFKMPNIDPSVDCEVDAKERRIRFGDGKVAEVTFQGEAYKSKPKSALKHSSAQAPVVGAPKLSKQELVARSFLNVKNGVELSDVDFDELSDDSVKQVLPYLKKVLETQFSELKALKNASDESAEYINNFDVYRKDLEKRVLQQTVTYQNGTTSPYYALIYAVECICQPLNLFDDNLRYKDYAAILNSDGYNEYLDSLDKQYQQDLDTGFNASMSKKKAAKKQQRAQEELQYPNLKHWLTTLDDPGTQVEVTMNCPGLSMDFGTTILVHYLPILKGCVDKAISGGADHIGELLPSVERNICDISDKDKKYKAVCALETVYGRYLKDGLQLSGGVRYARYSEIVASEEYKNWVAEQQTDQEKE